MLGTVVPNGNIYTLKKRHNASQYSLMASGERIKRTWKKRY
jgi:hypothetical protein